MFWRIMLAASLISAFVGLAIENLKFTELSLLAAIVALMNFVLENRRNDEHTRKD